MISVSQYRLAIGLHNLKSGKGQCGRVKIYGQYSKFSAFNPYNRPVSILFYRLNISQGSWEENIINTPSAYETKLPSCSLLYFYFMILSLFLMLSLSFQFSHTKTLYCRACYFHWKLSYMCISNIKVGYLCLFLAIFRKSAYLKNVKNTFLRIRFSSRVMRVIYYLLLYILIINFLLIAIVNPSLLNPGPKSLKICFQNVQGLIPFKELELKQPSLIDTKINELNAYIDVNKPDVILLNETWLKPTIENYAVIKNELYHDNIFRNDRSRITHPADPLYPNKYRKYGGGVLIAFRSDLKADIKRISCRKGAEILAYEISINEKKFVFCTVYRVGNLGEPNHESIMNTVKTFYKIRNPRKIFIIGDFNLKNVIWPQYDNNELNPGIEKSFVDSFNELGLEQCITEPTHIKGKTLDLLFTNSKDLVSNLKVSPDKDLCFSDHYLINFEVITDIQYKKVPKRKIHNFKKANWAALNNEFNTINWNAMLDCKEPEIAWHTFKNTVSLLTKKHVPLITIKSDFTSPWFDAECFEAYRDKERAHKKFKDDLNNPERVQGILSSELNFKHKRYMFKNICNKKMRDNLYNEDDPELITKKFCSHVKASSKSSRLPETMHFKNIYRNKSSEKAELFNVYFFNQFSSASKYDIDIDWSNDSSYDIDFSCSRINKLVALMAYMERF